MRLIGTGACPRFDECPVLEPLICKKIAHERLTALIFREDCFVTACQDGYVYTWARPGKMVSVSSNIHFEACVKKIKLRSKYIHCVNQCAYTVIFSVLSIGEM
jgi:hypothetical protein